MNKIMSFFAYMAFVAFVAIAMVEWASGCGESYVDAAGKTHQHQCWIVR